MARRKPATPAPDDPRTVEVIHPDQGSHMVTPEVAAALEQQKRGWTRVGGTPGDVGEAVEAATAPLKARIAELEAQLAANQEAVEAATAETNDDIPPPEGDNDPAAPGQED